MKSQLIPFIQQAAKHPGFTLSLYASQIHVQLPLGSDVTALSGSEFFYTQDPFTNAIVLHISFPCLVKDLLRETHYLEYHVAGKTKAWRAQARPSRKSDLSL